MKISGYCWACFALCLSLASGVYTQNDDMSDDVAYRADISCDISFID